MKTIEGDIDYCLFGSRLPKNDPLHCHFKPRYKVVSFYPGGSYIWHLFCERHKNVVTPWEHNGSGCKLVRLHR